MSDIMAMASESECRARGINVSWAVDRTMYNRFMDALGDLRPGPFAGWFAAEYWFAHRDGKAAMEFIAVKHHGTRSAYV